MIPSELIIRKRSGRALRPDELQAFITDYLNQAIPDYQMAALLMAIYFRGMETDETIALTRVMINSGEQMDFRDLSNFPADKHSTGGVGDKVSLILGPLLAAAGLAIPMISGRSLGHTGGTLDKLESIPGFRVNQSLAEFRRLVETVGIGMIGQTSEICPADKRMYALRDVTGTVESIPLIGSSIMSKKIAEGIRGLVIDLKTGNGAFMKTLEEAHALGNVLQAIGNAFGVRTDVLYTNMNQPLGRFAGVWCEILESVEVLNGAGPADTRTLTLELGARLMLQSGKAGDVEAAKQILQKHLRDGSAYGKFLEMVAAQGGNPDDFQNPGQLNQPKYRRVVKAPETGVVEMLDTTRLGWATVELGCGRKVTEDLIDPTAGMEVLKKPGDSVQAGEPLVTCFCSDETRLKTGCAMALSAYKISDKSPAPEPLIYAIDPAQ